MRTTASILHLDLDAFFASVEQRDKPSLRGRPVIVGGVGARGVVSTASYEARRFGVRSAMSMTEARSRCPHAAFLAGRFDAYREASSLVMGRLRELSPLVEPLSLDEAFVDLQAAVPRPDDPADLADLVAGLRADIVALTGLTCSVGVASSKFMAKIASELNKPDGSFIVQPGTEQELLGPMQVTAIPGVGPATAERLRRMGVETVQDAREKDLDDLLAVLGNAGGQALYRLTRAEDDRAVEANREAKSVSVEDTFEADIADRERLSREVDQMAARVAARLRRHGQSGRTVTLKVRRPDFDTHTRSSTLPHPTDDPRLIRATARALLEATDVTGGLRLVGVGVSALADWVQEDLFSGPVPDDEPGPEPPVAARTRISYVPGMDVHHDAFGDGWVWGSGLGRVTVRFETRHTPAGRVLTFAVDDPALSSGHAGTVAP